VPTPGVRVPPPAVAPPTVVVPVIPEALHRSINRRKKHCMSNRKNIATTFQMMQSDNG
jgi:hypothetical protein